MKIALVSSIFVPGFGYLEEGLAKVLSGMHHEVTVFSSRHYPFHIKDSQRRLKSTNHIIISDDSNLSYKIKRLKTLFKLRSNIISYNLKKNILSFNPDLIILVGVSDFFPLPLITKKMTGKYKICAFIGQNFDMWHWRQNRNAIKKTYSLFVNYFIKGFIFRKSIKYLYKLIFYTPDTEIILQRLISKKLRKSLDKKKINIPLGYNSDDFYFMPYARISVRKELNIDADKVVFVTATRIDKSKKINEILNTIYLLSRNDIVYIIIGFIDNSSKTEVEQLIEKLNLKEKVFCYPFLSGSRLAEFFSAADFGIWLKSGASIQQAMGTGLPVILPENSTTSKLINEGLNGHYIGKDLKSTLDEILTTYSFDMERRSKIEAFNKNRLSYQSILERVLL